jgi:hypothetical protein
VQRLGSGGLCSGAAPGWGCAHGAPTARGGRGQAEVSGGEWDGEEAPGVRVRARCPAEQGSVSPSYPRCLLRSRNLGGRRPAAGVSGGRRG